MTGRRPPPAANVDRVLRHVAARFRRRRAWTVVLLGGTSVAAWLLSAALVDRSAALPAGVRWGVLTVAVASGAATVVWAVLIAWRPDDPLAAARRLEARDRTWEERLVTVATQSALPAAQRGSAVLNAVLAAAVDQQLRARPPVVRPPRRAALAAAVAALLWTGLWALPSLDLPQLAARELRPWAMLTPVTLAGLDLIDPPTSVRQGRGLSVTARVNADGPPPTAWVGPDAAHLREVPMRAAGPRRYAATLPAAQRDFVYRVTAGDAAAGPVAVRVLRRPGVLTFVLRLDFPASVRRPPLTLTQSDGCLAVPIGTRVSLTLTASEPLKRVRVLVGEATLSAQRDPATEAWRTTFVVSKPVAWAVDLTADNGLHGTGPVGMRFDTAAGE